MEPPYFSKNDIKKIETGYCLSKEVTNVILSLEKLFKVPTVMVRNENNKDFVNKDKKKKKKNIEDTSDVSWDRVIPTKISVDIQTEFEKERDFIRISLNKISDKNYLSQKDIIFQHLLYFEQDKNEMEKIANIILETASSNKFYSELYANLYKELVTKYSIFLDLLLSMVYTFNDTLDTIRIIDANVNYDGFCECIKENEKRRSVSSFLMMLCKQKVIAKKLIIHIIKNFQKIMMENMEKENKTPYVEEIAEILFIFISIGHKDNLFSKKTSWIESIVPIVFSISKMKNGHYPSLSSRTIFKHLDLVDILSIEIKNK